VNKSLFSATSLLIVASFLTTGALATLTGLTEWYSVWAMLAVVGAWLILVGLGVVPVERVDRKVLWGSLAVAAVGVASSAFSGHPVYSALYDTFAHMPLVVWLSALAAFVLASMLHFGSGARNGLVLSLVLAGYPVAVGLVQAVLGRPLTAFGNSNYFVSIVVMLAVVALGVARTSPTRRGRIAWRVYALVLVAGAIAQGTLIGYLALPVAVLLILAADPALLHDRLGLHRALRVIAASLAGIIAAALLFASIPAVTGSVLTAGRVRALGANAEARVDLWRGAERMFAERPLLGYGPGGYKLVSAKYAGPAAYRVAAVTEPLDVAPPSPHSVLWTGLTTFGAVGVLALLGLGAAWVAVLAARRAADASDRARSLRLSLGLGFALFVFVLLTVPVSAAQGLLPAVVAGLALASPTVIPEPRRRPWMTIGLPLIGTLALVAALTSVVAYSVYWTMAPQDLDRTLARFQLARTLQPGDPLYRFREYEYRLMNAGSDLQGSQVRSEIDADPDVVRDYAPGLVGLAALSMDEGARTGRSDYTWEQRTLDRARELAPYFPTLVAEELHLAAVKGDRAALRKAVEAAKRDTSGLPQLRDYLSRAESLLATGTP
jgi:O-antigen ligase